MKIRQRVAALAVTVLLGVGGAVTASSPAAASSYGPFRVVHSSGFCLEVPNYSYNYGEQLWLNWCGSGSTNNRNQLFYFDDAPWYNFNYSIVPAYNYYCLYPGNVNLVRSTIIQWGCSHYWPSEMVWVIGGSYGIPGYNPIYNLASGMCLTTDSAYSGAYVRQNFCNGGIDRLWQLQPA